MSLVEMFKRLRKSVPTEALKNLPTDGAKNYKHYLYGHPKVSENKCRSKQGGKGMTEWTPITIQEVKDLIQSHGHDQAVLITRKVGGANDGKEQVITTGLTEEDARSAGVTGEFLKYKIMGWKRDNETVHEDDRRDELLGDERGETT